MYRRNGKPTCCVNRCAKRLGDRKAIAAASSTDIRRSSDSLRDEFNCRSRWSDARSKCAELEFLVSGDHVLERAFEVPSLRNVAERAPCMHAGQFGTLAEVIEHYKRAPKAAAGHSELNPLRLSAHEQGQLEAFLRSLSGDIQ
jgi:cytochrome c peroxidase